MLLLNRTSKSLLDRLNDKSFSRIRDLILLLYYGGSLSLHSTVSCGIKFLSIFRILHLQYSPFR